MGKKSKSKKGVNPRARKRANEAAALLQEAQAEQVSTKRVEAKSDSDLFIVDTVGDSSALAHIPKKQRLSEKKKRDKNALSEKDKRQVKRIIEVQGEEGALAMAKEGRERMARRRGAKRVAGRARTDFDLWGCNGDGKKAKPKLTVAVSGASAMGGTAPVEVVIKREKTKVGKLSKEVGAGMPEAEETSNKLQKVKEAQKLMSRPQVAVEVARAGQSYRPDPEAHQDVIGEALAIELRRNDAIEYKETPISQGLSDETKAILVGSDGESSSDDDDSDDAGEGDGGKVRLHKKKDKLTRAQRNKQRRVKAEKFALERRKEEKRLLASMSAVKTTAKEVAREEAEKAERREELKRLKAEKVVEPLGKGVVTKLSSIDPIRAPALPVALTSELIAQGGGTLRTVRPKGSLLTDRMESLADRKMAARKTLTKKNVVQGKKRKMKGGKHREFLLI